MPQSRRCALTSAKACASVLASLAAGLLLLSRAPGRAPNSWQDLWRGPSRWVVLPDNVTVHKGSAYNPHNFSYLLDNPELCADKPRLLVMVASDARRGPGRRQAIRDTWGQRALQEALRFRLVFLLANPKNETVSRELLTESYTYGDIVQEDFPESFGNLALKSVMGLKWLVSRCSEASYGLKTDDDIFLHIPNLLAALDEASPLLSEAILCHSNPERRILRLGEQPLPSRYQKYCVSRQELPGTL